MATRAPALDVMHENPPDALLRCRIARILMRQALLALRTARQRTG